MYYVLFTKILQGGDEASGTVLHKDLLEFVVQILDNYTGKEFIKFISKTEIVNLRISASNN